MTVPPNPMANQPAGYDGDAGDWLMGGGVKSFSFAGTAPITAAGTICEPPSKMQKRNFDTGEPEVWNDGQPRIMMKVVIQTDQRDPSNPDDDGKRALYLENRKAFAVRDACKAVGANRGPEVGGYLTLTYTGDDLAAKKGRGLPPKNFSATYQPPNPMDAVTGPDPTQQGGWGQLPAPAQPTAHPVAPAVPQQYAPPAAPAAPVPPAVSPGVPSPSAPAGVDPVAFLASKGLGHVTDPAQAAAIASQFPDYPKG